ncbi:amidohydrolase family protein [Blastococcus sp. CT_GayMR20]|uniref:metal-dependent hydrolase family protein n=1 Tax=Blastococcus sp. CT_GayMR20 TaxID=2559609 RepID=UPI00107445AC|nr:amidohydrolase family protein [Blastococcus sp. CT_GayMR20]TFV91864.1 amidohydrolase family protein [Blastococcus sp. CT_GayMR20]TFV91899.1 amidohydrolase family protein [Blastococcus sp. CT_GayMR20]
MRSTLFAGGYVFDGTGSAPSRADVLIEDGVIRAVGTSLDGDTVVDTTGRTVLPGLIDAHVHLTLSGVNLVERLANPFSFHFFQAVVNCRRTVATGITTVRDAAGADLGLKQALARGLISGPRALIAVNMISQTGGHNDGHLSCGLAVELFPHHPGVPSGVADGPDEMRRTARTMLRAGADVIKVATTGGVLSPSDDPKHAHLRPDELAALVAEADAAHVPVMAHAQGAEGIKNAVRAGVRSIEHGIFLDDEAIELMLAKGTWLVPTLLAPLSVIEAAERGEVHEPAVLDKALEVAAVHRDAVTRAVEAGVPIAMGTDTGIGPHGDNLRELQLLVDCGLSPYQAWAAATSGAAVLLRLADRIGSIQPGLTADLVILDGDLTDLSGLAGRVVETWQAGCRTYRRPVHEVAR